MTVIPPPEAWLPAAYAEPAAGDAVRPVHVPAAARAEPDGLPLHETARLQAAVAAARRRYPGPVGELLATELRGWADFGYRLGGHSLISAVVTDLLRADPL